MRGLSFITALVLFVCLPIMADRVQLSNDSKIEGVIESIKGNQLLINTGYGKLQIPLQDITSVSSDSPAWIRIKGSESFTYSTLSSEQNNVLLIDERGNSIPVDGPSEIDEFSSILPDKNPWQFSGNANIYFSIDRGNDHKDSLNADSQLIFRDLSNRHGFDIKSEREKDRDKTTKDRWLTKYNYNRFFSPAWYGLGNASWERNKMQSLDSRSMVGLGAGHQFWEKPELNLKAELGASQIWETYTNPDDKRENQAAHWSLHYDQLFWQKMTLFHDQDLFRRLKTSSWLLQTATGIRFKLTDLLHMNIRYEFDYDDDPQPGRKKDDSALLFGLGASW